MPTTNVTTTPFSTAMPFVSAKPSWLNEYDAQRLAAYALYDDMYRNHPDSMQLLLRGSDDKPIYVPTAKRLVNTFARYVLRGYDVTMVPVDDPMTGLPLAATDDELTSAQAVYARLFKRERFLTKLNSAKRQGLRMGDWVFYIWADPDKPAGSRISVKPLDPGVFFPIYDEFDPTTVTGVDIIEVFKVGNDSFIKRLRFLKQTNPGHPNYGSGSLDAPIARQLDYLETSDWETKPKRFTGDVGTNLPALPLELLPGIMHLPVYHIKTNEDPDNPFGTSILAGLESVIAGLNQGWTDEDMALAMAGLGFYCTDSGAPIDEATGETVDWQIGPSRVVEVGGGKKFTRVSGVATVDASQEHLKGLTGMAEQTLGINDVATGAAEASVAESGIALAIRMGPLLDATGDIDTAALEVLDQMLYDLRDWFATYEGIQMPNVTAVSQIGDKLPMNRAARFAELKDLFLDGLITMDFFHQELTDNFGYDFPPGMKAELIGVQEGSNRLNQAADEDLDADPDADPDADDEV